MKSNEEIHEFITDELLSEELNLRLIPDSIKEEALRIASKFNELKETIERANKALRERCSTATIPYIGRLPKRYPKRMCALAIDTSFTSPPMELTGGRLGIIYRVAVQFGSCGSKVLDSSAMIKFIDEGEKIIALYSKIAEREYVYEILTKVVSGEYSFDIIIIDGELIPRVPPGALIGKSRGGITPKLYEELVKLTNNILELADKEGILVTGILKRVYGRDIQVLLGDPSLDISDKALSSYILRNGEYINLGTYVDIVNAYEDFLHKYKEYEDRLRQRFRWMKNAVRHLPLASAINVVIYKPLIKTYFSIPTKIEIQLSGEYMLDEVVAYLSSITSVNGVPFPIDIVDRLSRVRKEVLFIAQQSLYSLLTRLLGDNRLALSIIGLTNPEKMRSIGFKG